MPAGLNKEPNLILQVRLVRKGDDRLVSGPKFKVRLYDKDVFNDDYLGESGVKDGFAEFTLTPGDYKGPAGLDEKPDFYFVVYHDGKEVFRSRVMQDLDISDMGRFISTEGHVVDLGTFLIDTE
ncbi:MAG: hypothetical protein M9898_07875 [Chitinophagaceae bacterium]|nr:hypothetical protein [Chitinophagaceae bacterium]